MANFVASLIFFSVLSALAVLVATVLLVRYGKIRGIDERSRFVRVVRLGRKEPRSARRVVITERAYLDQNGVRAQILGRRLAECQLAGQTQSVRFRAASGMDATVMQMLLNASVEGAGAHPQRIPAPQTLRRAPNAMAAAAFAHPA